MTIFVVARAVAIFFIVVYLLVAVWLLVRHHTSARLPRMSRDAVGGRRCPRHERCDTAAPALRPCVLAVALRPLGRGWRVVVFASRSLESTSRPGVGGLPLEDLPQPRDPFIAQLTPLPPGNVEVGFDG